MGAMMGMPGMMGMYNLSFMGQMNQAYHEIEKQNLEHAGAMHKLMLQTQTQNYQADDQYLFQKSLEDGSVNTLIINLADKIREGDADGICEEFDKLKSTLYTKHADYLKANSNRLNPSDSVNNVIENLYAQIITAKTGQVASLRHDIKQYGETAFNHGFNKNFFGKKDYHNNYSEETLSYLFGTRIDNKAGKDRMETFGGAAGRVAEAGTVAASGAAAGIGASILARLCSSKVTFSGAKWMAAIGAVGGLAADVLWQMSRD